MHMEYNIAMHITEHNTANRVKRYLDKSEHASNKQTKNCDRCGWFRTQTVQRNDQIEETIFINNNADTQV